MFCKNDKNSKTGQDEDHTSEPLSKDPWFIGLLSGAFIALIAVGIYIIYLLYTSQNPQYEFSPDYKGFENLVSSLEPAFRIFTAFLIFAGIRGVMFRSEQTAEQLNHAKQLWGHEQEKSNFSQHNEHREIFKKTLGDLEETLEIKFNKDMDSFHNACFENLDITNFDISIAEDSLIQLALENISIIENITRDIEENYIFSDKQIDNIKSHLNQAYCNIPVEKEGRLANIPPEEEDCLGNEERYTNIHDRLEILCTILNAIIKISTSKNYAPDNISDTYTLYSNASNYIKFRDKDTQSLAGYNYVFIFGQFNETSDRYFKIRELKSAYVPSSDLTAPPTAEIISKIINNHETIDANDPLAVLASLEN
ncbi:hypothetical protein ACJJIQ_01530 [Microbulbifer sp. ANSA003]|uniref:hypothetical protein n=1 Tax=Microbulbifer sp. ANSA003 TaxID=3243360 RepID=UPI004043562C